MCPTSFRQAHVEAAQCGDVVLRKLWHVTGCTCMHMGQTFATLPQNHQTKGGGLQRCAVLASPLLAEAASVSASGLPAELLSFLHGSAELFLQHDMTAVLAALQHGVRAVVLLLDLELSNNKGKHACTRRTTGTSHMMPLSNGKTPLVFMLCDGVVVQPGARCSS